VRSHVKEEEISFFGTEDALVYETFGEAFADLFELEADFEDVPCFTYKE